MKPVGVFASGMEVIEPADMSAIRARAEVARHTGAERYAIIRVVMSNIHRADLVESTVEPEVARYLLDVLADEQSQISQRLQVQSGPFACHVGEDREGDPRGAYLANGLCHVFFRRNSPTETYVYVAYSLDDTDLVTTEDLMCCLGWMQIVFDDIASSARTRSAPAAARITQRERECLRWCAEGKTSEEIILTLSTHTVNHYLISATKKLNAANRMHAITTAIRLGILDIDSPI